MADVFNTALYVLITETVLVIIYLLGVNLIAGQLYPMFYHLRPNDTESEGISEAVYVERLDRIKTGFTYGFYILLAIPFVYLIVKLLYEREETSVYGGLYR